MNLSQESESTSTSTGESESEGEVQGEGSKAKRIPRQGSCRGICWNYFELLKDDDERWLKDNHTHMCTICNITLPISSTPSKSSQTVSYIGSQPNRHLMKVHPLVPAIAEMIAADIRKKAAKATIKREHLLLAHVLTKGDDTSSGERKRKQPEDGGFRYY